MRFSDRPIHQKLLIIVLSTLTIAILLVSTVVVGYDRYQSKRVFNEQIKVLADVTANLSGAALVFNDQRALMSNLTSLLGRSAIDRACVYDGRGSLVVQHQSQSLQPECKTNIDWQAPPPTSLFREIVLTPIKVKNRNIGYILVEAHTRELEWRLLRNVLALLSIGVLAGIAAWHFTKSLRRSLLWPLLELNAIADSITISGDYSVRIKRHSGDEIGSLARTFNRLIGSIQNYEINTNELILELKESKTRAESDFDVVEKHNQQIKELFAGASHDLRQPLQAMVLFVTALKNTANEQQAPILEKLELALDNLSNLFEDLLDVSRLEAKLDSVDLEEIALKPLLEKVFHEFNALADDKDLRLRFHVRDAQVLANATLLERIVRNLLSNAIRYTQTGGVLLSCRQRSEGICLDIWDTGPGIPKDKLDTIFEQFVQIDSTPKEGHREGFGLGLSIVKRLSQLLGLDIQLESRLGHGSRFRIILPVSQSSQPYDSSPALLPAPPSALHGKNPNARKPQPLPPMESLELVPEPLTLILIDDDPAILESLGDVLESWGMNVLSFSSIDDIKQYFRQNSLDSVDLIISDFEISQTETGLDAIELLQDYFGDDTPAIIISGTGEPKILKKIQSSDYPLLRKPVSPATLRSSIHHLLGRL